jgi:hypothetical protein
MRARALLISQQNGGVSRQDGVQPDYTTKAPQANFFWVILSSAQMQSDVFWDIVLSILLLCINVVIRLSKSQKSVLLEIS